MQHFKVENPEKLVAAYSSIVSSKGGGKSVGRGGSDLRKLDEAGSTYEFVITYTFKPGRFAKEKTVVAIVPVRREMNGLFECNVGEVTFRVLAFKKGNFEEEWSGDLEKARSEIPDVVRAFEDDIADLSSAAGAKAS